jgi:SM-20-related protein
MTIERRGGGVSESQAGYRDGSTSGILKRDRLQKSDCDRAMMESGSVASSSEHAGGDAISTKPFVFSADLAANLARSAMRGGKGDHEHLLGLAEICRRAGAIEEALDLLSHIRERGAACTESASLGERLLEPDLLIDLPAVGGPIPFVRQRDFLSQSDRDAIFDFLKAMLSSFETSRLLQDGKEVLDDSRRKSSTLRNLGTVSGGFDDAIRRLINDLAPSLIGEIIAGRARLDLHAQAYGNGDFFGVHRDAEIRADRRRIISFVYYISKVPRPFKGGELLLFDDQPDSSIFDPEKYSTILPEDNSLILFPSYACHEVRPVVLDSADPTDGRFSISGSVISVV